VNVGVRRLSLDHARWWDHHVQPSIDGHPDRADRGWNWPRLAHLQRWAQWWRGPIGFTLGVRRVEHDSFVPCALVFLLGRYSVMIGSEFIPVFAWYLGE